MRMVRVYEDFAVNTAAIPVIAGRKSRIESFAGVQEGVSDRGRMGSRRELGEE